MLKDELNKIDFEASIRETCWIGDPDVDAAATDKKQWVSTGEGAIVRAQGKPSRIRYRPLYPREQYEVSVLSGLKVQPDGTFAAASMAIYDYECARIGIVSIDGVELSWDRYRGVRGLSDESLHKLDMLAVPSPPPEGFEGLSGLMFLTWIGGLIQLASFRERV